MPLPTKELKTRPLARFQVDKFRKLIQGLGLKFLWSRAIRCPCALNTETLQSDPTCARCGGHGWQYINPCEYDEPGINTRGRNYVRVDAILSNLSLDPSIQQPMGGWSFSDGMLTVEGETRVGFRDQFIAVDHLMAWTEYLVRGADVVPVGREGRSAADKLTAMRYAPVTINWVSSDVSGVETIYYPTTDFTVIAAVENAATDTYEPAKMVWNPGMGPAVGQRYTVHYECHPVWLVDDATYSIQGAKGPPTGLKGVFAPRMLPTTFKVVLDYITEQRGT